MALQFNYTSQYGTTHPTAYGVVQSFNGTISSISFNIAIYADEAALTANNKPLAVPRYSIPYTPGADLSALYTYLLTLPEYAGAVTV
jgi:hypothetical protein